MNREYSIYTIKINPEYKDFANTLMAVTVILIVLHLLMTGQKSTGLIGSLFNSPFSDTFSKILISIAFYYLVFRKMVTVV
jgi:hypothetical protein